MNQNSISELKHLVPDRPGILLYKELLHTAILIPLWNRNGKWQFIFEKRAAHIRQGGEVCFPGGFCEKNKDPNPLQTALRETEEELGLSRDQIEVLGQTDTLVASRMMSVESFLAVIHIGSLDDMHPAPSEVAEVFALPVEYFITHPPQRFPVKSIISSTMTDHDGNTINTFPAADLGIPEKYHRDWSGGMYEILVYPSEYGPVWGLTARFVYDLTVKWKRLFF